jgi:small conductance mechanosensitive channel
MCVFLYAAEPEKAEEKADKPESKGLIGEEHSQALRDSIIGKWAATVGTEQVVLHMNDDGRIVLGKAEGTYEIKSSNLNIKTDEGEFSYKISFEKKVLTLSEGDLSQPLKFTRQAEAGDIGKRIKGWFVGERSSLIHKMDRILVVILIVIVSRLLIFLLQRLSRFLIFYEKGPVKYVYRANKKRKETIHSIILNIIKYVVYFTALGFILSEMGINYTAYLASLSVIGLAIGFGSQDLVKDVVNGFFILFEGHYDVGDMVEISGQVGIVENFGLRMTRIRNYLDQIVVIPNRNISVVGRFTTGALNAFIDIAVQKDQKEDVIKLVNEAGTEIGNQFDDVIIVNPKVEGGFQAEGGAEYIRVTAKIWPKQEWVINQEFVPRIKEVLTRNSLEIPGDKVVVFYHEKPLNRVNKGQ